MPNANARALSRRAGMESEVGSIVRLVRVLRYGRYVRSYLPELLASLAGRMLDLSSSVSGTLRRLLRTDDNGMGRCSGARDRRVAAIDTFGDCLLAAGHRAPGMAAGADSLAHRVTCCCETAPEANSRDGSPASGSPRPEGDGLLDSGRDPVARSRALLDALAAAAAAIGCASVSINCSAPDAAIQSRDRGRIRRARIAFRLREVVPGFRGCNLAAPAVPDQRDEDE